MKKIIEVLGSIVVFRFREGFVHKKIKEKGLEILLVRKNTDVITPSHGLFLTCRWEKQKIIYNKIQCTVFTCWVFTLRIFPHLGRWPPVQGANLSPLLSHVGFSHYE
jgi:hypothetical protein